MFHTAGLCLRGADHAATCIMHEKCSPNVDQFERNNTEKQHNSPKSATAQAAVEELAVRR